MAATRCSARNASRCALPPRWAAKRGGLPSTCSFSACRTPRAKFGISAARSRPPAARPTSRCSFLRRRGARRAGSAGASATISPGCAPARTAGSGPSTPKTAFSASLPARARKRTPTPSPRRAGIPSSRTSFSSRTAPSGGKDSIRTRRQTRSTGRVSRGIPPPACPGRIRTPASPPRRSTARAFRASLKTRRAFPSPPSCSAAAVPRPRRSFTRVGTGPTAYLSAASWLPKRPPRPRARSARPAATRWRCSPSAATTWATTGSTGWIWKSSSQTRRSSPTSTGSAPTTRAVSSGRASATTCA